MGFWQVRVATADMLTTNLNENGRKQDQAEIDQNQGPPVTLDKLFHAIVRSLFEPLVGQTTKRTLSVDVAAFRVNVAESLKVVARGAGL